MLLINTSITAACLLKMILLCHGRVSLGNGSPMVFVVNNENSTSEDVADQISRNVLQVAGDYDGLDMSYNFAELALCTQKSGSANDYCIIRIQMDKYARHLPSYQWTTNTNLSKPKLRLPTTPISLGGVITTSRRRLLLEFSAPSGSNKPTSLNLQRSAIAQLPASMGHLSDLRYMAIDQKPLQESIDRKMSAISVLNYIKRPKIPKGILTMKNLSCLNVEGKILSKFEKKFGAEAENVHVF